MASKEVGRDRTMKKMPCGHCKEECKRSNSVSCGFCEFWFHSKCVDGMTPEFLESWDKMTKLFGGSAFLCVICRSLATKINKTVRELETKLTDVEAKLKNAELERKTLAAKVERIENKSEQVTDKIVGIEREIETGMEKAMQEAKSEVTTEMKEREARSENIVVYGVAESVEREAEERKGHDKEKVSEIAREIGVELKGAVEVKFRAGKKKEGEEKPRPMVVWVEDEETRSKLLSNARRLARKEEWRRVYLSPDLTWQQREEARKEELKLREEADRKTEEAKNEGRGGGRFAVVGPRGRRRVVWREEREATT